MTNKPAPRRRQPPEKTAAEEGRQVKAVKKDEEQVQGRLSKAAPERQTPAQRARNAEKAQERIRAEIRELVKNPRDLGVYVMTYALGKFTRHIILQEAPWMTDPANAFNMATIASLAACSLNHVSRYVTLFGCCNTLCFYLSFLLFLSFHAPEKIQKKLCMPQRLRYFFSFRTAPSKAGATLP